MVLLLSGCVVFSCGASGKTSSGTSSKTSPSTSSAPEPSGTDAFKALRLRLVGVVNSNSSNRPKALVSMAGVEEDQLVGEGDLLGGFTLSRIGPDQIELEKGGENHTLTIRNLRWVKADRNAKIVHATDGSSSPASRSSVSRKTLQAAAMKKFTAASASKRKTSLNVRPRFVRPMIGRISSPFGKRIPPRTYGGLGSANHEGTDIAAPHGTPVYASAAGTVAASSYSIARGRYIRIRHTGGYETRYYHLSKRYVKVGQLVKSRQRIGAEGRTGNSNGAHLHFEIRRNGVPLDASKFISSLKYLKQR